MFAIFVHRNWFIVLALFLSYCLPKFHSLILLSPISLSRTAYTNLLIYLFLSSLSLSATKKYEKFSFTLKNVTLGFLKECRLQYYYYSKPIFWCVISLSLFSLHSIAIQRSHSPFVTHINKYICSNIFRCFSVNLVSPRNTHISDNFRLLVAFTIYNLCWP